MLGYAGQDQVILQLSGQLVNKACKAAPGEAKYAVEAGYLALLQGDPQTALGHYSQASHLHELDMDAMYGSIECDLMTGKVPYLTWFYLPFMAHFLTEITLRFLVVQSVAAML